MINEFKYGQIWKIWPSPLSLSLYSISDRHYFLTVLASIEISAWAIHSIIQGEFFNEVVAAIHFFRGYMEQIIFDSSY